MFVSVLDAEQAILIKAHNLRFLRRSASFVLATFLVTTLVLGAVNLGSELLQSVQADQADSAVALESYNPYATSSDSTENSLVSYFKNQQATSVRSAAQPFRTSGATLGAHQAQLIRAQSKAQFIGAFQDKTGVKVNLYQSKLGTPMHLAIDQQAVATMLHFTLDHLEQANSGYLSTSEMNQLKSRAQTGGLGNVTLNIIVAASPTVCNDQLIPATYARALWKDKTCETAGTYFPMNLSSNQPVEQTMTLSLFGNRNDYSSDAAYQMALNQKASVTLAHEMAHAVADLSGARARQLASGVKETDLDNREHKLLVDPMEDLMNKATANILSKGIDKDGQTVSVSVARVPFKNRLLKLYQ